MEKFRNKYRIEPNRSKSQNYSDPGHYFITICINNMRCIFGNVLDNTMQLSVYGEIVNNEIKNSPKYHKRIALDSHIVMPNHVHFIVSLGDYDYDNGVSDIGETTFVGITNDVEKIHEFSLHEFSLPNTDIKQYRKLRRKMIIPKLVGKFQMITSKQINKLRDTPGMKNWQSNYHDHVIRDNISYQRIRNYIISNPMNWDKDIFYG